MSSIYKNYQINVGIPFEVKIPQTQTSILTEEIIDEQDQTDETVSETDMADNILADAREEAELLIKEAGFEAERILNEAAARAESDTASVFDKARQEGYRKGTQEAELKYKALLAEAQSIKLKAEADYRQYIESIESDVVNVILDTARCIIGTEVKSNREYILELVRNAFGKCSSRDSIILKVGTQDYEFVQENREALSVVLDGMGELDIKCDPAIKSGGCMLETPYGTVDASVQTKMKKVEQAFRNAINHQSFANNLI